MFKCENCGAQTPPRTPSTLVIIEKREKVYPARPKDNDPGGIGYETVKEIRVCPSCGGGISV